MPWKRSRAEPADLPALRAALAEADAWCSLVAAGDPAARLWSAGLLDLPPGDTAEDVVWRALSDDPYGTVATLLRRRRERLPRSAANARPTGRVLLYEPNATLFCGASRQASDGLVDLWDVPAWDMWIAALPSAAVHRRPVTPEPVLLAWVPSFLLSRADEAAMSNPTEAITWLDRWNPALARDLGRAG